jgi:hypothetical protein
MQRYSSTVACLRHFTGTRPSMYVQLSVASVEVMVPATSAPAICADHSTLLELPEFSFLDHPATCGTRMHQRFNDSIGLR